MLADQTVIKPIAEVELTLLVNVVNSQGKSVAQHKQSRSFTVGRSQDNDIRIDDEIVSRKHLAIKLEPDGWWLQHLNSTNGVYINGRRIADKEKLTLPVAIGLGRSGLTLVLQYQHAYNGSQRESVGFSKTNSNQVVNISSPLLAGASNPRKTLRPEDIEARLLAPEDTDDMGDYTLMVRRVIRQDRAAQNKHYLKLIWLLAGLLILSLGLASYQKWF